MEAIFLRPKDQKQEEKMLHKSIEDLIPFVKFTHKGINKQNFQRAFPRLRAELLTLPTHPPPTSAACIGFQDKQVGVVLAAPSPPTQALMRCREGSTAVMECLVIFVAVVFKMYFSTPLPTSC